jgi:hypothetical protein
MGESRVNLILLCYLRRSPGRGGTGTIRPVGIVGLRGGAARSAHEIQEAAVYPAAVDGGVVSNAPRGLGFLRG